jgi:hypothetical protein
MIFPTPASPPKRLRLDDEGIAPQGEFAPSEVKSGLDPADVAPCDLTECSDVFAHSDSDADSEYDSADDALLDVNDDDGAFPLPVITLAGEKLVEEDDEFGLAGEGF